MHPVDPPLSRTRTPNLLVFVHIHMSVSLVFKMPVWLHACLHVWNKWHQKHILTCFLKIKCESVCALSFWDETAIYRTESHPWWCSTSSRKNREKRERQARSLSLMGTSPRAVHMPAPGLITRDGKKGGTWGEVEGTKRERERERHVWWWWGTTNHWSHSAANGHSYIVLFNH